MCGPQNPDAPNPDDLHLTLEADPLAVRVALCDVMRGLEPRRLTGEQLGTLELILAEVLNNVVEHAYAQLTGVIELSIRTETGLLWCEVADHGEPMPDGRPPEGQSARVDVAIQDLPEGGFGWFLIRSLTRDLTYRRDGETNRLCFALDLEGSALVA